MERLNYINTNIYSNDERLNYINTNIYSNDGAS